MRELKKIQIFFGLIFFWCRQILIAFFLTKINYQIFFSNYFKLLKKKKFKNFLLELFF